MSDADKSVTGAISIEELASLPSHYIPKLSYDRTQIAYYGDQSGQMELYVMDAKAGAEPRQVSNGEVPRALRAGFCWSRDGKFIIFPKDNHGDEQHNLWRIDLESGAVEQLTDNPTCQEYPVEIAPDNRTLLVNTTLNGQLNVHAFDLETKTYTQLTDYQLPAFAMGWSPDGSQIAYMTNETTDFKNNDIYTMGADGSNQQKRLQVKEGSGESVSDWSADGKLLAVATDAFGGDRVGVFDLSTDEVRWFSPETGTYYAGKFSPDGKRLTALKNVDASVSATVYNVETGEEEAVEMKPGMSFSNAWLDEERFLVGHNSATSRTELRDYDMRTGASEVFIGAEYGSIDPALFVNADYISYPSYDGLEIHAILYRPRNIEPGKTYPALVHVHGGPTAQFFRGFDNYAQLMADRGYFVIEPNPRGSTGYGVEFRDMGIKDWGGGDLEDIAGAAAYLRDIPEVDNDRVGIWGVSYGGYMTYIAVTKKPDLWKAGLAWVGMTDLKLLHDGSMPHFAYYLEQQLGDPEENADLYADRSAVNFAHQMTAHLFIVHGTTDPRCPIDQARTFRDKLVELGKREGEDFDYLELAEEGHGSTDIAQKTRMYKQVMDYFGKHL